jgi:hypothetical protein
MEQNVQKLNKIIESLTNLIEQNIVQFSKAASLEDKKNAAEILQFLSISQKNTAEVLDILTCEHCDATDDDFSDDDFDIDDFEDKGGKGRPKGKRSKNDEDLPF